jgi:DHA1 family inner membrane transport protein
MKSKTRMRTKILTFSLYRMLNFAGIRMVFPFLTLISLGLGTTVEMISIAVSVSGLSSIFAPFFAQIGERYGKRVGMLSGMSIVVLAGIIIHASQNYLGFFIGLILLQLSINIFSPAMQAYLSENIPLEKRGTALSLTELGWPLSYLLLIPLIGLVIEQWGWSIFYLLLSASAIVFMAVIAVQVEKQPAAMNLPQRYRLPFREIFHARNAVWGMIIGFCLISGNIVIQLVFGVWLESAYQASIAQLSIISSLIGGAELAGILLSALFIDRIGIRRAITLGIGSCAALALTAVFLPLNLIGAGAWLVIFYFSSEFAIVSALTLISELYPQARNTYMAIYGVACAIGFGVGSILAPLAFRFNINGNMLVSFLLYSLAGFGLVMVNLKKITPAPLPVERAL